MHELAVAPLRGVALAPVPGPVPDCYIPRVEPGEELLRMGASLSRRLFGDMPKTVGRYRIAGRIGSGGMGEVYRAHDPSLDRPVAIKVLRVRQGAIPQTGAADRLMREARALAQVSHPNVVEVYEVGAGAGAIFIAMELVDGETLADWSRDEARDWRDVVAAYLQAGEGLAAAHAAGVLHRDFKPSNALRGRDGRVRVVDFGLAKALAGPTQSVPPADEIEPESPDASSDSPVATASWDGGGADPLTMTGSLLGTPAYMAPECLRGLAASEAGDQYSFCVALWEALFGSRPYVGDTPEALRRAAEAGRWIVPAGHKAPRRLVDALGRGISPRASDRWPSMRALLDALKPMGKRRGVWSAVAVVGGWLGWKVAAGAVLVMLFPAGGAADPCGALHAASAADWSAEQRASTQAAFSTANLEGSWPAFADVVDERMASLPRAYAEVCTATRTEEDTVVASPALACIRRHYVALSHLTSATLGADQGQLSRLVSAVHRIPGPRTCEGLSADESLAPKLARATAATDEVLAEVAVMRTADRYDQGIAALDQLLIDVEPLDDAVLLARIDSRRADIEVTRGNHNAAEAALLRVYQRSVGAESNELAMTSAARLAQLLGVEQPRTDEALQWARHSEAAARRLGREDPRAHLWRILGNIHFNAGNRDEARVMFEHAAKVLHEDTDASLAQRIHALRQLGNVYLHLGAPDLSAQHFAKALDLAEAAFGPQAHDVGALSFNLGLAVHDASHDPAQAIPHFERAAEIYSGLWTDHPDLGDALYHWGQALAGLGRADEAEPKMREGIAMLGKGIGTSHPYVLSCQVSLAELLHAQGRDEEALALATAVHADAEGVLGETHPLSTEVLRVRGLAYEGTGDIPRARAALTEALRISKAAPQPDASMVWEHAATLAEFHARHGEPALARTAMQSVLEEIEKALGRAHPQWAEVQLRRVALFDPALDVDNGAALLERAHRAADVLGSLERPEYGRAVLAIAKLDVLHGDAVRGVARAKALHARLQQDPREQQAAAEVAAWLRETTLPGDVRPSTELRPKP